MNTPQKRVIELINERARIDKEIEKAKAEEEQQRRKEIRNKLDALTYEERTAILKLMQHDRTSCSDAKIANGMSYHTGRFRCRKCMLIEIFNGEHGDEFDFNLTAEFTKADGSCL